MEMFEVQVKLANPGEPSCSSDVSLLVDTGATLSWVPRELLQKLGVRPTTRLEFQFTDGRTTLRDVGAALFTLDGKTVAIPCALRNLEKKVCWARPPWRPWVLWSTRWRRN